MLYSFGNFCRDYLKVREEQLAEQDGTVPVMLALPPSDNIDKGRLVKMRTAAEIFAFSTTSENSFFFCSGNVDKEVHNWFIKDSTVEGDR